MDWHGLQRPHAVDLEDYTLRQYQQMYRAFFAEKSLIPAGNFHEVRLEKLEKNPLVEMANLYDAIGLPGFSSAEPLLRKYAESQAAYQKNRLPEPEPAVKARVRKAWEMTFDAWAYPTN
jgi:LPS sulfotransferase NodH